MVANADIDRPLAGERRICGSTPSSDDHMGKTQVRTRLLAGPKGIRTAGPSREKGGGCGSEVDAGAGLRGKPRTLFQEPYAIDLAGRAAVHPVVFFGTGTDTPGIFALTEPRWVRLVK